MTRPTTLRCRSAEREYRAPATEAEVLRRADARSLEALDQGVLVVRRDHPALTWPERQAWDVLAERLAEWGGRNRAGTRRNRNRGRG